MACVEKHLDSLTWNSFYVFFDRKRIKTKAIFESDLLSPISKYTFKGDQETFPDLVASLM